MEKEKSGGGGGAMQYDSYGATAGQRRSKMHGSLSANIPFVNPFDITTHNNFLTLPGTLVSNQKGDLLRFTVPSGYSHFECCAFSKVTGVVKKYDYPVEKIEKKSLSHTGIVASAQDAAWTMSR